jgi:hypothetical protein
MIHYRQVIYTCWIIEGEAAMKTIFDSENKCNQAYLEALNGHTDKAIELLRNALEIGYTRVKWVLQDPDLNNIRVTPKFKKLISDYIR